MQRWRRRRAKQQPCCWLAAWARWPPRRWPRVRQFVLHRNLRAASTLISLPSEARRVGDGLDRWVGAKRVTFVSAHALPVRAGMALDAPDLPSDAPAARAVRGARMWSCMSANRSPAAPPPACRAVLMAAPCCRVDLKASNFESIISFSSSYTRACAARASVSASPALSSALDPALTARSSHPSPWHAARPPGPAARSPEARAACCLGR